MTSTLDRLSALFQRARSGHVPPPVVADLPPAACAPPGVAGADIRRDRDYLTVTVHELALAQNQQWWTRYDPLVVAITELIHGGQRVCIPAIVGPETIRSLQPDAAVPAGIVLRDTPVAGPFPYRGGAVALTVMLYRVKVGDHAQRLLGVLEGISKAIGVKEVETAARMGGALVSGLEALLDLQDTVPVAGQRTVQDGDGFRGFRTGFSALVAPPGVDAATLRVIDGGRLHLAADDGTRPADGLDYVLCGIQARPRRGEIATLPFARLLEGARAAAAAGDDEGWQRARAGLLSAYQQMVASPDLTANDADQILSEWREKLVSTRKSAKEVLMLSGRETLAPDLPGEKKLRSRTDELLALPG